MNISKEDLKPGDIVMVNTVTGVNLFEVLADPPYTYSNVLDLDRAVYARCFFGHWLGYNNRHYWLELRQIAKVFKR